MSDGNAPDLVITTASFLAFVLPLIGLLKTFSWSSKALGNTFQSMQRGFQRMGNRAANTAQRTATRAAKNSVPGLRVQQLLNERKASRVRTAQDRNQQLIGGSSPLSALLRRGVAGNDPARQAAFQEQMRSAYQDRTMKSFAGKNPIALGDLAQFNRGESVDDYVRRNADIQRGLSFRGSTDPGEQRTYNNTLQRVAALQEMHQQFGDQLGTDEFREVALKGALNAGANTQDVMRGFETYVRNYGGNDGRLAQSLGDIAQTAKAAGFAEYSAVGFQGTQQTGRTFNQYQIKAPSGVMRNMDLTKQETGQFYINTSDPANAQAVATHTVVLDPTHNGRTELGQEMFRRLTTGSDAERNAMLRDISLARRSKPFNGEYVRIVEQANAELQRAYAAGGRVGPPPTDLEAELQTMLTRV
ncbi:MAG TPA: hypothetical protein VLA88_06650 [Candidatus Saccharimonadales bacterium]|nr:hypothetical protein [Candidatus Saccharimonadales bacterium]